MRAVLHLPLAVCLAALPAIGRSQAVPSAASQVSGEIRLLQGKSARPAKDASEAVVWLVPADPVDPAVRSGASRKIYRIVQRQKQFHPRLLVVPLGSVVSFPNLDPWFHNVFSLYRGTRFDLGLYEAGSNKQVRFDRLGPSYIFCNIHPEMMAVVLTVDTSYYAVTDKAGHWSIPGVPPGRYTLHVWYENAAPAALQALHRVLQVGPGNTGIPVLVVPVTPHDWLNHLNLYGRKYDPGTLTPVY